MLLLHVAWYKTSCTRFTVALDILNYNERNKHEHKQPVPTLEQSFRLTPTKHEYIDVLSSRRCKFMICEKKLIQITGLFTLPYFSVRSSRSKTANPNSRPLGTYEIKMAARTGKRSILTLIRKTIRNYVKSTRLRTNSFERMEINPNSIKYAIL